MFGKKLRSDLCVFVIFGTISIATCVKINNLHVPEVIKHRTSVVLDCDFSVEDKDEDLVVKWYLNRNNRTLVYQWIPASNSRPQVLGVLKDRLNIKNVGAPDANKLYRALHILEAQPDLSGNYTCSVSSLQSEDIRTKSMLVFVPEKLLVIRRLNSNEGIIRIRCTAEGVFPSPVITLQSKKRDLVETEITSKQRGNLYDISVSATLKALEVPEEFSCELSIPQANYTVRKETVIYPGSSGSRVRYEIWLSLSTLILVFKRPYRQ
ncbi:uncharacterized protein LOC123311501 isoform X2 [Coccinella septempunctata]|uniref:uncharacterized protein LOC123311501 isoform X2 n=1 Tax=Coccinella septempunctata TaxID=41139 RepID=UPI001D05FE3C|nr:uncharacterized protein LOC123311501 isoform X2 [Coccinella septempunctata]